MCLDLFLPLILWIDTFMALQKAGTLRTDADTIREAEVFPIIKATFIIGGSVLTLPLYAFQDYLKESLPPSIPEDGRTKKAEVSHTDRTSPFLT